MRSFAPHSAHSTAEVQCPHNEHTKAASRDPQGRLRPEEGKMEAVKIHKPAMVRAESAGTALGYLSESPPIHQNLSPALDSGWGSGSGSLMARG